MENRGTAPTVGSHRLHWFYFGKGTKGVDWQWGVRWFDLDPDKFPFRGLKR